MAAGVIDFNKTLSPDTIIEAWAMAQGDVEGWPLEAVAPSIVAMAVAFRQANPLPKARYVSPHAGSKRARSCEATPPPAKRQHGGSPATGPATGPAGGAAETGQTAQLASPSGPESSTPAPSSGASPVKAAAPGSPAPAPQQQPAASASMASTGYAAPADTALSPAPPQLGLTAAKAAVAGQLHYPFPQVHGSLAAALAASSQGSLPSHTKQCSELC